MLKYAITSGKSIVESINETDVKITKDISRALLFDKIGDAIITASQVNKIVNKNIFRIESTEVTKLKRNGKEKMDF